ncbi:TdeIII family type II restriction endonuclease [Patescibacteria group bacterium]|nr:TdeIII family type II restriction endonuclease [Patescibacteria group bacterium]
MAIDREQKIRIEELVKNILIRRMGNFPEDDSEVRNAPFHHLFLRAFEDKLKKFNIKTPFLIALSSWMHGLNTSLGSGFEDLAHILSGGFKRKFTGQSALNVKKTQAVNIENIIRELKSGEIVPDLKRENELIFDFKEDDQETRSLGFTADNYIENNSIVEAIEIKSVRPNSGEGRGEKQKILYGKAAFKLMNRNKKINFYIGFPFDPTASKSTDYDKERFFKYLIEFKKFFDPEEVLIGPELWDHLSGSKGTMEEMLEIISNVVKRY